MANQIETKAIPIGIKSVEEPWTIITLIDGTVIKIKLVIMGCNAIYDTAGNQLKAPDGQLLYNIEHAMVHKVVSLPSMRNQSETKQ